MGSAEVVEKILDFVEQRQEAVAALDARYDPVRQEYDAARAFLYNLLGELKGPFRNTTTRGFAAPGARIFETGQTELTT